MTTDTTPLDASPDADTDLVTWGRRAWSALEALHVPPYFSAATREACTGLGLHPQLSYFALRSAAMGPVPAEVVEATFYVFAPRAVRQAVPACWEVASPEQVLVARYDAAERTLHEVLDDVVEQQGVDLDELAGLARRACEGLSAPGRPLYAGHASLPWPQSPLMQLWHAATLLREHRGDGHVAALVTAGLDPIEAMLTYGLTDGPVSLRFLRRSRGWTDAEWLEAAERLRDHGLVAEAPPGPDGEPGGVQGSGLALTPAGASLREELEASTDLAALSGWKHLGEHDTRRLASAARPLAAAVVASGALGPSRAR